jgi:putative ABC transport system permease protein
VGKYETDQGRELEDSDFQRRRPVCVIGSEVAETLFPRIDPVGQSIKVSGFELLVVGTLVARGNVLGQSQDNIVIVPLGQFGKMYGSHRSLSLIVSAATGVTLERLEDEARVVLRAARHVPLGAPDDFAISTAETYMALYQTLTGGIFAGTIGLVAISLVVGGIVIMNIMLMTVNERVHEIGIRKSVGATRRDIRRQFLVEAVVLASLGGALGVLLGWGAATLVASVSPLPARVTLWSVGTALMLGAGAGVLFGVYPATRAARLDPINALRAE